MLNKKKFFGFLLVPIVLGSANMSFAVSETAMQNIQGILEAFIDIQPETNGAVTSTTISPSDGSLGQNLISKFTIKSNASDNQIYLKATTESSGNVNENAFFLNNDKVYIILSNLTNKPEVASVADCKVNTPTPLTNSNAIAYPVDNVALDNSGTVAFNKTKLQYNISAQAGQSVATTTVGKQPLTNTYSYDDTPGTYQAVLTLSTTSL